MPKEPIAFVVPHMGQYSRAYRRMFGETPSLTLARGQTVKHPELASRAPDASIDARYVWFATPTLFTVESLWTLMGEDERWEWTLEALLRPHRGYIQPGVLGSDAFDPDFYKFLKSRFSELKCAPS